MEPVELRSTEDARRFLVQGLCLHIARKSSHPSVQEALSWIFELLAEGHPIPPPGFVSDVGQLLTKRDVGASKYEGNASDELTSLLHSYTDRVLSRLYADRGFDRAADATSRLTGRDKARAVAYVVERIRDRVGSPGVLLPLSVVKSLQGLSPAELVELGRASLEVEGVDPVLRAQLEDLIAKMRINVDLLGNEDVFELEHGTANRPLAERVALRQVLQATAMLNERLPSVPPARNSQRGESPSGFVEEDVYPVGGFASISNRGSIESLLHSQLAYMEPAGVERPDLFDVKFIRDELLYYSRDDNQFLRHRRRFVFVLHRDLTSARVKDAELPYQRIIMIMASVVATISRLIDWLDTDALQFEILLPADKSELDGEENVLRIVLQDLIVAGTVRTNRMRPALVEKHIAELERRSKVRVLVIGERPRRLNGTDVLSISSPIGELGLDSSRGETIAGDLDTDDYLAAWAHTLHKLISDWL